MNTRAICPRSVLRSSDVHFLQCKGSTLFTTITIHQATETYFRLTAPIIYRQNLTVPNWRRHKPTASDNRHERHLKLRERRKRKSRNNCHTGHESNNISDLKSQTEQQISNELALTTLSISLQPLTWSMPSSTCFNSPA